MFRPIGIPQRNPASHPPTFRERGSHTTDGTAVFLFSFSHYPLLRQGSGKRFFFFSNTNFIIFVGSQCNKEQFGEGLITSYEGLVVKFRGLCRKVMRSFAYAVARAQSAGQ